MIWSDTGYLLSKNKFGENSIIAEFYCKNHGKISGVIYGATSKKIRNYLKELSGRKHNVYGGMCVISPSGEIIKRLVKTEVYFKKISENELNNSKLLNEGKGKAGGYAIQGYGCRFVRKIRGSYTNVVGLSIVELNEILETFVFRN